MSYTFKQFEEATDKNHSTRQDFIKNLLTLASGMLAILAAFNTSGVKIGLTKILYLTTLGSLSLGILAGGLTLYFDTVAAKSIFLQMKTQITKQLENPEISSDIVAYNPPALFYLCEKICYIALLLSVISLASYSAFK